MPARPRLFRRRGRTRKLKYSWKSAGHPSIWKRIADGKNQSCKQYTPCGCQSMCGKQCPCLHNGTCCEKYCGYVELLFNRYPLCVSLGNISASLSTEIGLASFVPLIIKVYPR